MLQPRKTAKTLKLQLRTDHRKAAEPRMNFGERLDFPIIITTSQ